MTVTKYAFGVSRAKREDDQAGVAFPTLASAGRLLAAVLVAAACTPGSVPSASPSDAPVRGGRIVVALTVDVTSLDPLLVSDGMQFDAAGPVTTQLYDTLAIADRKTGEILPRLATWTAPADGRTYEFELAANAVWSDGQPIVAQDFITAMRALARSKKASFKRPRRSLASARMESI